MKANVAELHSSVVKDFKHAAPLLFVEQFQLRKPPLRIRHDGLKQITEVS